jgi:MFS family permease
MRICDPMLPRLSDAFGALLQSVSAVVTWFAVAYGVLQIAWGPIGDRFGKFRLSTIATSLAAFASIACALAPDLITLTAARFAAGAIGAAIIPLSLAWIGDVIAFEHRQPVLARFMSGSILGSSADSWSADCSPTPWDGAGHSHCLRWSSSSRRRCSGANCPR